MTRLLSLEAATSIGKIQRETYSGGAHMGERNSRQDRCHYVGALGRGLVHAADGSLDMERSFRHAITPRH